MNTWQHHNTFHAISIRLGAALFLLIGLLAGGAGVRASAGRTHDARAAQAYSPIVSIDAGGEHTCALKADGTVDCWGLDNHGQSTVPSGTFTQVSAGGEHTCGVRTDNTVDCWGSVEFGQAVDPGGTFTQVSAGEHSTCGVRTDGTVDCWGTSFYGEANDPAGTFLQVSAGGYHTCGVRTDYTVSCWGEDRAGKINAPGGIFREVSAGTGHTCGVMMDGSVDCWGSNTDGQAADPGDRYLLVSAGGYHTCGIKTDGSADCWGDNTNGQAADPADMLQDVSAGGEHTCAIQAGDGRLLCWGKNYHGQLSVLTLEPASLPNAVLDIPYPQTITASGGTEPYNFRLVSGSLPDGLYLSGAGEINGAPTTPGKYDFVVGVEDANGLPGQRAYTITTACLVTTNANSGAGSLREKIGDNSCRIITFANDYDIVISSELVLNRDVRIDGMGRLVSVGGTGYATRVFNITSGTVELNELTILDGYVLGNGGGILNAGNLRITRSTFKGNRATLNGGGIYNDGTLTVEMSEFQSNASIVSGAGGAIFNNTERTLNVTQSAFRDNWASNLAGNGGGIASLGRASIANSNFHDNHASDGGGIASAGPLQLRNNTISHNQADLSAGGLYHDYGMLNSTILINNIIAENTAGIAGANCVISETYPGVVLAHHNLSNDSSCPFFTVSSSINLCDQLTQTCGSTKLIEVLPDSSAIGAGDDNTCGSQEVGRVDFRGLPRFPGAYFEGDHCDIGAYEAQSALNLDKTELYFDPQEVGSSSPAKLIRITNSNERDLQLGTYQISGDFSVTATDCYAESGASIPPNGTCTLSLAFSPASYGAHNGSITIPSNAASSPDIVNLHGAGIDTHPPVLSVPPDMTAEAASAAGAVVSYPAATAADAVDPSPTIVCIPASGSTFPLGDTSVDCTATDDAGNASLVASFTITVQDTTPPDLAVPTDMLVNATSAAGAMVNFAPTAADTVDPSPAIVCLPASSSLFPLGDASVDCTATDDAGNVDNASFTVTVQENPDGITLYAPADGEILHYNRPAFDWSIFPGATGYQIQFANDAAFARVQLAFKLATPLSSYTPASSLPANRTFFWRVRPITGSVYGPWSTGWSFTTANPPGAPRLLLPANRALLTDYTPRLDWSQSSLPLGTVFSHYQVQVDDDPAFGSPAVDEDVPGLAAHEFTPLADMNPSTQYYWHVRTWNLNGDYTDWTTVRSFRTAIQPPELDSPTGGGGGAGLRPVFDWTDAAGATGYSIQVSRNAAFTQIVLSKTSVGSTYTPTANLPAGITLYWRVRANGPNGPSAWSTVETFQTP